MNNNLIHSPDGGPFSYSLAPYRDPNVSWNGQAERPSGGLDLAALLHIIRERRLLIVAALVAGLLAGVAATVLTKPMYRAWVTLEVNPPSVEILDEQKRSVESPSSWDFIATQVGLLSSQSLARRVAQDLNLASDPDFVAQGGDPASRLRAAGGKVAAGLKVIAPEEGQLIKFSYDSESPTLAAKVANGLADGFIGAGLQRKFEASSYARRFLEREIAKTRADLEASERQLVSYAQAEGIINTSSGAPGQTGTDAGSLQGESLIALNKALADATARRVMAQGAYRQAQLEGGGAEVNESTQQLRQTRAGLEAEYQEKRTLLKPDHPDMLSLRSRIDELDRQIARERTQVASGRTTTLLADYRAAQSTENQLRAQVAGLKGSVLDLRGRSIRYNILQRDVDTNRGLYDALLQRYKEIGVGGNVSASPILIVDRAEVPGGPFKPQLSVNLLLGALAGLLAGLAAAVGLEYLNDTIKTREDVRRKLGLACLGVVPRKAGKEPLINDLEDPSSAVSEAYSAILAALRFSAETGAPKSLLVTSANPSEGKSSSALALSQNYARRGERVLLIDADLRRPAFKGTSKTNGVTNLLSSQESIRAHVINTQHENLWLLPCGPIAPNPADLLSSSRFGEILAEAAQHFDRVVIDAPPVLGLADATFLAAFAHHVLLVIEAGKTRTRAAREAIERIVGSGAHLVGATLTKATGEGSQYGYYNYRYGAIEDKRKEMIMISQQPED